MNKEEYIDIGYFSKPHGFKGHLSFHATSEQKIKYEQIDHILIEINNLFTPFFIEKIDAKGKIIFKLEQVENEKDAKKIQSKHVYVNQKHIQHNEQKNDDNYIGFLVVDLEYGELGEIMRIDDLPSHQLWAVKVKDKEVLLPVEPKFINDINHTKKTINYTAPEGLISLYLD